MNDTKQKLLEERSFAIKCNMCGAEGIFASELFDGKIDIDFPYSDQAEVLIQCDNCKNSIKIKP